MRNDEAARQDRSAPRTGSSPDRIHGRPAVLVRFEIEAAPVVIADYLGDSEASRMEDWLAQHPRWLGLIVEALELAKTERAA